MGGKSIGGPIISVGKYMGVFLCYLWLRRRYPSNIGASRGEGPIDAVGNNGIYLGGIEMPLSDRQDFVTHSPPLFLYSRDAHAEAYADGNTSNLDRAASRTRSHRPLSLGTFSSSRPPSISITPR